MNDDNMESVHANSILISLFKHFSSVNYGEIESRPSASCRPQKSRYFDVTDNTHLNKHLPRAECGSQCDWWVGLRSRESPRDI